MKFLVDNALPPTLANGLRADGHDAVHVRDIGMHAANDTTLFELAVAQDRVILSADTDFGTLLALRAATRPSTILFRGMSDRGASNLLSLLRANLSSFASDIDVGAVVVIENTRIRVRRLPILA